MRTSKMTSLLGVLSATVLAVAVAGSVVPASAAIRMGGGGFGRPHFGGGFDRGFADRHFRRGFGFRGQRFVFVGFPWLGSVLRLLLQPVLAVGKPLDMHVSTGTVGLVRLVGPAVRRLLRARTGETAIRAIPKPSRRLAEAIAFTMTCPKLLA
jgi:hypothetical protein